MLSDGTISEYPDTTARLSSTARIVSYPAFESGIVKIQNNQVCDLTDAEKSAVLDLKRIVYEPEDNLIDL